MKILNRFHLHPYLIGIFPVLSLYAHNQSQLQPEAPWRSLAVIMIGTTVIFIVLRLYFKDWHKAGFVTSYASLVFFLYNPLWEIARNIRLSKFDLGLNRYFFPVWLLILVLGIWVIVKKLPRGESTIRLFNIVCLAAILLPSTSIISFLINHYPDKHPVTYSSTDFTEPNMGVAVKRPDIYYIILDMYGRSDTIEEEFGYDNSQFLADIREQGFYVAACSTSNYSHTVLSMASSLNMNFLPALGNDFVPGNTDYADADAIIENNIVRQYLQKYGYSFVSLESDFPYIDIPDSDVYIKMPKTDRQDAIQPFELVLMSQTPLKISMGKIISYNAKWLNMAPIRIYGARYDRTLFMLEKIPQLTTSVSGPKFVYAHLIIPHPPYVFGPDGQYVGNDERLNGGPNHTPVDQVAYHLGYINQMHYIDSILPDLLKQIISQSEIPPVIVVQGDHGFWGEPAKRLPILNAYYLPGKDADQLLYAGITPVNSFRVILNAYFNGQFELLPDEKYYSADDQDFYEVELIEEEEIECMPK